MEHVAKPLNAVLAPLRPSLKQITQHLPAPVSEAVISQIGSKCYRVLILEVNAEPECMKQALSKVLGLGIIAMSAVVKLPQLVKILEAQTGAGLSFSALALETVSFVVTAAYNFRSGNPITTYGEAGLIGAQNMAIGTSMLAFDSHPAYAGMWIGTISALAVLLSREQSGVSFDLVQTAMAGASALGVLSKVPQIWTNYQQGSTGQLSAFAVFAFLFGSASRIFTTIQEVDDPILLAGFASGFALNLILALQMLYYWNAPAVKQQVRKVAEPVKALAQDAKDKAETTGAKVKAPSTRRRG